MKKIVFVPLDERPCNYYYPTMLPKDGVYFSIPPRNLLSDKKNVCDINKLNEWVKEETKDADFLAISLDTLIYGGIVPSRVNNDDIETLYKRSNLLKEIKERNKNIKIIAFELIMRCPTYNSGDEEPDYYSIYGERIHNYGELIHKEKLGIISDDEKELKQTLINEINKDALTDYTSRREKNLKVLINNLKMVINETIDFFIIPQDDTSVYGYTTMDKEEIKKFIINNHLESKVEMYPSADDTGMTVLARALTCLKEYSPKMHVIYAAKNGEKVIPNFEDQEIDITMDKQIRSAGLTRSTYDESDIILFVNIGSFMEDFRVHKEKYYKEYYIDRDIDEFISRIEKAIEDKKLIAIADVAFANQSDPLLISKLKEKGLLYKVHSYTGWNTSSNTIGSTIGFITYYFFNRDEEKRKLFLSTMYLEDFGYMGNVRPKVSFDILPNMGLTTIDLKDKVSEVETIVKDELNNILNTDLKEVSSYIKDFKCTLPWKRMFEVFLEIDLK